MMKYVREHLLELSRVKVWYFSCTLFFCFFASQCTFYKYVEMATYNLLHRKGNCLPARPKYNHIPRSDNDVFTEAPTHRTHIGDTDPEVFIQYGRIFFCMQWTLSA